MNPDFITWLFDKHYIASTIFLPWFTFFWCCYKGLVIRGIVAFLLGWLFNWAMAYRK